MNGGGTPSSKRELASALTPNHSSMNVLEIENDRLRNDLERRERDQLQADGDLVAVMSEWRERVAALENRLDEMARIHRVEKEELTGKIQGMYSAEVVNKLQRDLASALNLRESAMADDLDARETVIMELGTHLRYAHESNQRLHLEMQDLQAKYHEEISASTLREASLKQHVAELQDALRDAQQKSMAVLEAQRSHQDLLQELAHARHSLLQSNAEKDRIKRESEWAVSKMTAELQRAQHALLAFEEELRESRMSKGEHSFFSNSSKQTHFDIDLATEKQRSASLQQQLDILQLELKRKTSEISQLQASLLSANSSEALSVNDTLLVSSPARRRYAGGSRPASPLCSEDSVKYDPQQERRWAMKVSEVASLRTSMAMMDRECIELHSALEELLLKERVMIESMNSKDSKIAVLESDNGELTYQLNSTKERELHAMQELKECQFHKEVERMQLAQKVKDLEREVESASANGNDRAGQIEAHSEVLEIKEGELRALQGEYDRAVSEWKSMKVDFSTKIAEANSRAATSQEAILLLESDLEMKNKLLDKLVESSGEGNETLNIYVAALHHAGIIAKSLDARNKELRKKIGEAEQYRLVGESVKEMFSKLKRLHPFYRSKLNAIA
jgi:chromosome segregation ATPase